MSSTRQKLPDLAFVLARSEPGGIIGAANAMPWHLKSDLARFKSLTLDHAVIMGRKTFATIGRPLARRMNIVMSGGLGMGSSNLVIARTKDAALIAADNYALSRSQSQIFVIGGAEIFKLFEPLCVRVHLTEVLSTAITGDVRFPDKFESTEWKTLDEIRADASAEDDFPTRYLLLERRSARPRFRDNQTEVARAH